MVESTRIRCREYTHHLHEPAAIAVFVLDGDTSDEQFEECSQHLCSFPIVCLGIAQFVPFLEDHAEPVSDNQMVLAQECISSTTRSALVVPFAVSVCFSMNWFSSRPTLSTRCSKGTFSCPVDGLDHSTCVNAASPCASSGEACAAAKTTLA